MIQIDGIIKTKSVNSEYIIAFGSVAPPARNRTDNPAKLKSVCHKIASQTSIGLFFAIENITMHDAEK